MKKSTAYTTLFLLTLLFICIANIASYAQVTTSFSTTISLDNLRNLNTNLVGNVVYKTTKSSRVNVVKTVSVSHPTKDLVIAKFISTSDAYKINTTKDFTNDTLYLTSKRKGSIHVDGKPATITESYVIYVPEGIGISVGSK